LSRSPRSSASRRPNRTGLDLGERQDRHDVHDRSKIGSSKGDEAIDGAMHEKIVAILSGANDMPIATVRPDGFAVMHVDVASLSAVHDGDHLAVVPSPAQL
jgi:hypothetical protein